MSNEEIKRKREDLVWRIRWQREAEKQEVRKIEWGKREGKRSKKQRAKAPDSRKEEKERNPTKQQHSNQSTEAKSYELLK